MNGNPASHAHVSESTAGEMRKYLSFRLGEENFGLPILRVRETLEYGDVTKIPMMPSFVMGALSLRGRALPVIDLALRLGKDPVKIARRTCIVVVEVSAHGDSMLVGMVVDAVNEVLDLRSQDIEAAPSFGGQLRTDFLEGMAKVDDKFLILLDADHVLSLEDLTMLEGVGQVSVSPSIETPDGSV